ncbi:hypothetical protein H5P28_02545 [Ruficoccus amylovorans]|uniref:Uncharacterized protein n=1 Tax=Ruficoccus amylovorans TaxID=1804625 RepID=A0A842HCK9_9BACT|nr:hypothetical protein [Ruficoccus amylovorans]MBC2593131.1 hypothetical protein [Ruficoccus amylovorans]
MTALQRVLRAILLLAALVIPAVLNAQPSAPEAQADEAQASSQTDVAASPPAEVPVVRRAPMQVGPTLDIQNRTGGGGGDSPELPATPRVQVRVTPNNYFQVAGEDYVSVQYVTHMAQQAGEYGSSLVPLSKSLPLPILVKLVPAAQASFESAFVIRPQPNGDVHVSIRWGEDTEFSQVCQALMSGWLVRCAIWRFGTDAAAEVPDWLELGAGLGLEVQLRPALIDEIALQSRKENPWSLERIFSIRGMDSSDSVQARRQCLWLLRFLENQSSDRERFQRLMAGFLKNLPPFHLLVAAFPESLPDEWTTAMWWAVGYEMGVRARQTPFYSLDESVKLIKDCATLTAEIDGRDVRALIHELYPYRGNPVMRSAARQRVREIKLLLQKVNPVYHNALLSLAVVYDTWLVLPQPESGDVFEPSEADKAYFRALELFTADYQTAELLNADIQRLLDW